MWNLSAITIHLQTESGETDHLTWGYDGKKERADFLQMILFEIDARLIELNPKPSSPRPSGEGTGVREPAPPAGPTGPQPSPKGSRASPARGKKASRGK